MESSGQNIALPLFELLTSFGGKFPIKIKSHTKLKVNTLILV